MGLLVIAILMGYSGIFPGRLHALVTHEGLVALDPVFLSSKRFLFESRFHSPPFVVSTTR
jgi:hypothetical protein